MLYNGKIIGKVVNLQHKDDYISCSLIQKRKNADMNDKTKPFDENFESWNVYIRGDAEDLEKIEDKKYYELNPVMVGISKTGKTYISVQAENIKPAVFPNSTEKQS